MSGRTYNIFYCETSNDGTVGGSHSCMYNLVRNMDRSRFRFTIGSFSENRYTAKYDEINVKVLILPVMFPKKEGIFFIRKAVNWYNLEYRQSRYIEKVLREGGYDLLLLNNTVFESGSFVDAAHRLGLPAISYERGLMPYRAEHIQSTGKLHASVAVSQAILRHLEKHGFRSKRMEMIYDGISPAASGKPYDAHAVKKGLGIPEDARIVGIVGNVRSWKGQKYFIEAFEKLAPRYPGLYGLVVGGWSAMDLEYLESLRKSVRDRGLEGRLLFLGYREDAPALLSVMDVFVHASILPEPFGMVLLEAMAAKVPIVATNFGGPVEILDGGAYGALVPPENGDAIAAECVKYLDDENYRRRIADNAYMRLCGEFDIGTTVRKVGSLIEDVIETSVGG